MIFYSRVSQADKLPISVGYVWSEIGPIYSADQNYTKTHKLACNIVTHKIGRIIRLSVYIGIFYVTS